MCYSIIWMANHFPHKETLDKHDYVITNEIDGGCYGSMYTITKNNITYAIKVVIKQQLIDSEIDIENEIQIHSSLKHPNIVELYEHFTDEDYIFMILEYFPTDLYKHMQKLPDKRIDEINAAKYLRPVIDATIYCHANDVIHRDLKPDNVLLNDDGIVKICDFGWSVKSKEPQTRLCGTLNYLCPQMIKKESYDYKCDIWCIGVLMYEMICGNAPFDENINAKTYKRIKKCDLKIPDYVTPDATDLLQKILVVNPNDRLSLEEILKHPWVLKTNC